MKKYDQGLDKIYWESDPVELEKGHSYTASIVAYDGNAPKFCIIEHGKGQKEKKFVRLIVRRIDLINMKQIIQLLEKGHVPLQTATMAFQVRKKQEAEARTEE